MGAASAYLGDDVKMTLVQAGLADGQSDPASSSVDMKGYDGVIFLSIVGTITGSGTVNSVIEQSADDSSFAALTGATATATAAAQSDKLLGIEVVRPTDRYLRSQLTRGVANSIFGGTIAIQYTARARAVAQAAAQWAATLVQLTTPAEV